MKEDEKQTTPLGRLFREYIKESGYTLVALEKMSGVERTCISKTINRIHKPERSSVKALIDTLKLTPLQQEKAWEAYEITVFGEDVFQRRMYIQNMIEKITSLQIADTQSLPYYKTISVTPASQEPIQIFHSINTIRQILCTLLEEEINTKEKPEAFMFLSFKNDLIKNIINSLHTTNDKRLTMHHMLRFIKNPSTVDNINDNLILVSEIMPYTLSTKVYYKTYYYYDNFNPENDGATIFPYYIILSQCVLLINESFDTALLITQMDIVNYYRKKFQTLLSLSSPLIHRFEDPLIFIRDTIELDKKSAETHWIEFQPCFNILIDDKLAQNVIKKDAPGIDYLYHLFRTRSDQLNTFKGIIDIFDKNGLDYFVKTGKVIDLSSDYARPFHISERILLLRGLKELCEKDILIARILNPNKFLVYDGLTIFVHGTQGVTFSIYNNDKNNFHNLFLSESTVSAAFLDFMKNIINTKLVYSKEETIDTISEAIHILETQNKEN